MRKKRSIRDVLNDLDKLKEANPETNAFDELMEKIKANRRREGYKSDYECLVELGVIEEVVAPHNAVNLFDTMKKKRVIVQEALKDPKVQARVRSMQADFKEACKQEGYLK